MMRNDCKRYMISNDGEPYCLVYRTLFCEHEECAGYQPPVEEKKPHKQTLWQSILDDLAERHINKYVYSPQQAHKKLQEYAVEKAEEVCGKYGKR